MLATINKIYMNSTTLIFLFLIFATMTMNAQQFTPPLSIPKPVKETLHGVMLTDPYRHLEDKENP